MKTITCSVTNKTIETKPGKNGPKLPRGWKRHRGKVYCPEAWKARFVLRAVTVPIVSPVVETESPEKLKEAWKHLDDLLHASWHQSTALANWAVQELMQADVTREPDMKKLPKMPTVYLYGMRDFIGWSQSATSVLRTVEAKYRSQRYERIWLGRVVLPNTRYPYPWPVHNKAWKVYLDDGNRPCVSFPLYGERVSVRLKGGARYRRQLGAIKKIISGEALRGELAVYKRGTHIMVKMVAWLPRQEQKLRDGALRVKTDPDSFLVGLNDKDERLFVINGDRMKRWAAKHAAWQQRFREDQKMEVRMPKRTRRKWQRDMVSGADKFRDRQKSFVQQTAAQIVNYADRRRLATVHWDDTDRSYFGSFPWYQLRERVKTKCDECGIELLIASDDVTPETS